MHYVYFLKSVRDNKYYIGYTSRRPLERLKDHNAGRVTSTKNRRPLKLIYQESFEDEYLAFKREWHLKHPKGYREKLAIIQQNNMGQ